jgi:hypothetical protein
MSRILRADPKEVLRALHPTSPIALETIGTLAQWLVVSCRVGTATTQMGARQR